MVELAALRAQLAAIEDEMIEGRMPAATGARVASRLAERIAEAEAKAAPVYVSPVVREAATARDPVAVWQAWPVPRKREFIKATKQITVSRVGRGRWHAKTDGITITPRRTQFDV